MTSLFRAYERRRVRGKGGSYQTGETVLSSASVSVIRAYFAYAWVRARPVEVPWSRCAVWLARAYQGGTKI